MKSIAIQMRKLAGDWQFYLVIAGSVLVGVAFWFLLPAREAQAVDSTLWYLASLLLIYPVVEEWVFRGVMQGELLKQEWGKRHILGISNANLVTSIVFVLLHFINHPPLWAAAVIVPSLVFGHFRERHGSLLPPILLHPFFNLVALLSGVV